MKHYQEELIQRMSDVGCPEESVECIRSVEKRLDEENELAEEFDRIWRSYYRENSIDGDALWSALEAIAEKHGIHPYTMDLIFLLNGAPVLKEKYDAMGLDDSYYNGYFVGLRAKLLECLECYSVTGTFVGFWFLLFFELKLYRVGRFECVPEYHYEHDRDYVMKCGKVLTRGTHMVELHIPSHDQPLTDEVRLAGYRSLYETYKDRFEDGIILFACHSWLLYPKFNEFLPETANVRRFLSDFEIVYSEEDEKFGDGWRLYGAEAGKAPEDLPRRTSFQQAYADWLAAGNKAGVGFGVFAFDGQKIIR